MAAGDIAGDREAEADALFILVAGLIEPLERLEGFLVLFGRDAGTVVIHDDLQPPRRGHLRLDLQPLAMDGGVHHQVRQRPLDRVGPEGGGERRVGPDLDLGAGAGGAFAHLLDQGADVDDLGRLAGLASGEGEVLVDHVLHLGEVALHVVQARAGFGQGQLELQAGERGAQIMAD